MILPPRKCHDDYFFAILFCFVLLADERLLVYFYAYTTQVMTSSILDDPQILKIKLSIYELCTRWSGIVMVTISVVFNLPVCIVLECRLN